MLTTRSIIAAQPAQATKLPTLQKPLQRYQTLPTYDIRTRISQGNTESRPMRYLFPVVLAALYLLVGCAAEVTRYPVTIKSVESLSGAVLKTVRQDVPVTFNSGYERVVRKNSTWKLVGAISQGKVYVSADGAFSVEGAHVHEAYLVVNNGNLAGFYLPVERSFAPLASNHVVSLWEE